MKRLYFIIFTFLSFTLQAEARIVNWDDLIPDSLREQAMKAQSIILSMDAHDNSDDSFNALNEMVELATPVDELNGQEISIMGFIVPLEFDQTEVTEFLLVPYMGACIHVPPPPANQIILVKSKKPVKTDDTYYPFLMEGTLYVEKNDTSMAKSGYRLEAKDYQIVTEEADFIIEDEEIEEIINP